MREKKFSPEVPGVHGAYWIRIVGVEKRSPDDFKGVRLVEFNPAETSNVNALCLVALFLGGRVEFCGPLLGPGEYPEPEKPE